MEDFKTNDFGYELKTNLEKLVALVDKLPVIIPDDIKNNADFAFRELESQISKSIKLLEAYEIEANRFRQRACDLTEETYRSIKESNEKMYARLNSLSQMKEIRCHIPYNFTEMIAFAERLGNLTEVQFERVLSLAKAFSRKEEVA